MSNSGHHKSKADEILSRVNPEAGSPTAKQSGCPKCGSSYEARSIIGVGIQKHCLNPKCRNVFFAGHLPVPVDPIIERIQAQGGSSSGPYYDSVNPVRDPNSPAFKRR
jgi:hypothetical protein